MMFVIFFVLLSAFGLVHADDFVIDHPLPNQVLNIYTVDVKFTIKRNGMLGIGNSTVYLMNSTDHVVDTREVNDGLASVAFKLYANDFTLESIKNYIVRISYYGKTIYDDGKVYDLDIPVTIDAKTRVSQDTPRDTTVRVVDRSATSGAHKIRAFIMFMVAFVVCSSMF